MVSERPRSNDIIGARLLADYPYQVEKRQMQIFRRKAKQLWTRRQVKVALAMLLTLAVCSIMQLEEVRPTVVSRYSLPDGTSGKVSLDQFSLKTATTSHFVRLEFVSTWTEATRSKSHSTLLHVGETEATGIRLDLGQSDIPDVFSYFLVVGSGVDANGYRFEEFPLTESDLGDARMSLLISNQSYEFSVFTNSGRVFQSQGRSAPIDYRQIYLGGGPPDLVPGFTDIRLYPSETVNSSIRVEHGEFRSTSRIGLPDSVLLGARWSLRVTVLAIFFYLTLAVSLMGKSEFSILRFCRRVDPRSTFIALTSLLWMLVVPVWWIQAGYRELPVSERFSFPVADGHCVASSQGIGAHCFGDYYFAVNNLISSFNEGGYAAPTGLIPIVALEKLASFIGLGSRGGLILYLAASVAAIGVPSIYVAKKASLEYRWVGIIALGIGSLPSMMLLDRGNNLAFVVPLLTVFVVKARNEEFLFAALALGLAAAFKPPLILATVLFLGLRQWRQFLFCLLSFVTTFLSGFVLWRDNLLHNLITYVRVLPKYQDIQPVSLDYPPNISIGRGLYQLEKVLEIPAISPSMIGPILILFVLVTCLARGEQLGFTRMCLLALTLPMLAPSVTFAYYLVLLLPGIAIFMTAAPNRHNWRDWIELQGIAVVFAITLVPLPFSLGQSEVFFSPGFSGLIWGIACLIILINAWIPRPRRSERVNPNLVN